MKKFQLVLVDLNPTRGSEINKVRPCVVVSPDVINHAMKTIIVAPLTSTIPRTLPTRILIKATSDNRLTNDSYAVLDQIKTIDKSRITGILGEISESEKLEITDTLLELFAY